MVDFSSNAYGYIMEVYFTETEQVLLYMDKEKAKT